MVNAEEYPPSCLRDPYLGVVGDLSLELICEARDHVSCELSLIAHLYLLEVYSPWAVAGYNALVGVEVVPLHIHLGDVLSSLVVLFDKEVALPLGTRLDILILVSAGCDDQGALREFVSPFVQVLPLALLVDGEDVSPWLGHSERDVGWRVAVNVYSQRAVEVAWFHVAHSDAREEHCKVVVVHVE